MKIRGWRCSPFLGFLATFPHYLGFTARLLLAMLLLFSNLISLIVHWLWMVDGNNSLLWLVVLFLYITSGNYRGTFLKILYNSFLYLWTSVFKSVVVVNRIEKNRRQTMATCTFWIMCTVSIMVVVSSFLVSFYVAQVCSEWFWGGSVCPCCYWYYFPSYVPHALYFYCKFFVF